MDARVLQAQQWVNATYKSVSGYVACAEDGITGWNTMYSLTMGLQHELGITALSDNFGDTTMSLLTSYGPISASSKNVNMRIIVEDALYCKGYSGGAQDGAFGSTTQAGLVAWKTDMGFTASGTNNSVSAKEMKTLLTMDAYVLLAGGDSQVRSVQRWLNATYIARKDFQIVPCDGFFSRTVQQGLIYAVQYSIGLADGVANGVFGPATQAGLKTAAATLSVGSVDSGTTKFVQLFKAALVCNVQPGVDWGTATFTSTTSTATTKFQTFCALPVTGKGDFETWCSLLVSTGDPARAGTACDCATQLNDARAKAVKAAGYGCVGRYIGGSATKQLTAAEITTILANGLSFFPIYQESNNALNLFSQTIGATQAGTAYTNAQALQLPRGSVIYFAVDFDATTDEIRSNILPYFAGIASALAAKANYYSVGVYGSRNICSMVTAAGYAVSSFVSGISTGYSGNLGFPLPANWSFNQIATLTVASGAAGQVAVDNDIKSGRDAGISSLTTPIDQNAAFFTWLTWIEARAAEWYAAGHTGNSTQLLTAMYLRTYIDTRYNNTSMDSYTPGYPYWSTICGAVDQNFITYANGVKGRPAPSTLRDPKTGLPCDLQRFGAGLGAMLKHTLTSGKTGLSMADFGAWADDLITATADCFNAGTADASAYSYAYAKIGNTANVGTFPGPDLVADIDATVVGLAIKASSTLKISAALTTRYASATAAKAKYQEFITARFGTATTMATAATDVTTQTSDAEFSAFRSGLWLKSTNVSFATASAAHPTLMYNVGRAFSDVVSKKFAT
jgi:peptidoglycan hydrolase-like protein with peptidoglycan-binding domain